MFHSNKSRFATMFTATTYQQDIILKDRQRGRSETRSTPRILVSAFEKFRFHRFVILGGRFLCRAGTVGLSHALAIEKQTMSPTRIICWARAD